jgi:acetyl-CoA carboxylase biotin carboxyl carrier protein
VTDQASPERASDGVDVPPSPSAAPSGGPDRGAPDRDRFERRGSRDGRDDAARATDHATIERMTDDLLPALVAKLGASGLAEIEVREGPWRVRLRRPGGGPNLGRRVTDGPSRQQPGHAGHGHAPAALEGHRSAAARDGHGQLAAVGPGLPAGTDAERVVHRHRAIATSPAVGIFQPRPEMRPGTRVRSGDRLGFVDVLGVPQEVVSPVDGIVGATLVESGDAVEYGQDLIRLELAGPAGSAASAPALAVDGGPPGASAIARSLPGMADAPDASNAPVHDGLASSGDGVGPIIASAPHADATRADAARADTQADPSSVPTPGTATPPPAVEGDP